MTKRVPSLGSMNKQCNNCKKEIYYYAGFCNHCETIQPYNAPKHTEIKIGKVEGSWFGSPIKIEKIPNNTIIKREYDNAITGSVTESWLDINKKYISIEGKPDYNAIFYYQSWKIKSKELLAFTIVLVTFDEKESEISNTHKIYDIHDLNDINTEKYSYSFRNNLICDFFTMVDGEQTFISYYFNSKQMMHIYKYGKERTVDGTTDIDLKYSEYYEPNGNFIGKINEPWLFVVTHYRQDGELLKYPLPHLGYLRDKHFFDAQEVSHNSLNRTYDIIMNKYNRLPNAKSIQVELMVDMINSMPK